MIYHRSSGLILIKIEHVRDFMTALKSVSFIKWRLKILWVMLGAWSIMFLSTQRKYISDKLTMCWNCKLVRISKPLIKLQ